jgi:hypothetical protein
MSRHPELARGCGEAVSKLRPAPALRRCDGKSAPNVGPELARGFGRCRLVPLKPASQLGPYTQAVLNVSL